jgi:hypothetical protein
MPRPACMLPRALRIFGSLGSVSFDCRCARASWQICGQGSMHNIRALIDRNLQKYKCSPGASEEALAEAEKRVGYSLYFRRGHHSCSSIVRCKEARGLAQPFPRPNRWRRLRPLRKRIAWPKRWSLMLRIFPAGPVKLDSLRSVFMSMDSRRPSNMRPVSRASRCVPSRLRAAKRLRCGDA